MFQFTTLGKEIVKELSILIKQQVMLTDRRGFIQASTDSQRINQFHEGALRGMRRKQILYIGEEEAKRLHGAREGIILPLIIEGDAIAAIGITGDPDALKPQAELILRVAELFIQDSMKQKRKEEKKREVEFFVFDWLRETMKDDGFVKRGALLGIDVSLYRQVALLELRNKSEQFTTEEMETFEAIQTVHSDMKMVRWTQNKIVLLLPEMNQETLVHEVEVLLLHMKRRKKAQAAVGIGGTAGYCDLASSFIQAERAVQAAEKAGSIVFERNLQIEIILQSIPQEARDEFLSRTIAPLLKEEELLYNLRIWFAENQSMQKTANRLHIHKNTLAYRLQKVQQLTGLSPSSTSDVFLLYLALRLIEQHRSG